MPSDVSRLLGEVADRPFCGTLRRGERLFVT
jgi:hypothetical protein